MNLKQPCVLHWQVYEKAFSIVTEELRISRWHIQFIIKYKERDVVRIAQDLVS